MAGGGRVRRHPFMAAAAVLCTALLVVTVLGGFRRADPPYPEVGVGSPVEVDALADRLLLAEAMAQLPDRSKRVIELAFFEELTHPEIAEILGLPSGTVKTYLHRARKELATMLKPFA